MAAISKELKVGVLTVVAGTILYLGFNFLKGIDFFSPTHTYYVTFKEIDGLTVSNPVLINGFSVGRVSKIEILQDENNKMKVHLDVKKKILLGEGTEAVLTNADLLSGKAINLNLKKGGRILNTGDTLVPVVDKGIAEVMQEKAMPVVAHIDSTIIGVHHLIAGLRAEGGKLKVIMSNVQQMSGDMSILLRDNREKITGTVSNFNKLSADLADLQKKMQPLITKLNTTADSLDPKEIALILENSNKAIVSLRQTIEAVNSDKGTMGLLLKTDTVHRNLNKTLQDLDLLLVDFKAHPRRYLSPLGQKEKKEKDKKK